MPCTFTLARSLHQLPKAEGEEGGMMLGSGWGQGPSACGALHFDVHPALQTVVVEEVIAGGDHASGCLAHICWVHADHTLTACNITDSHRQLYRLSNGHTESHRLSESLKELHRVWGSHRE